MNFFWNVYDFSMNLMIFEDMTWSFGQTVTAANPTCDVKIGLFKEINVAFLPYTCDSKLIKIPAKTTMAPMVQTQKNLRRRWKWRHREENVNDSKKIDKTEVTFQDGKRCFSPNKIAHLFWLSRKMQKTTFLAWPWDFLA